MTTAVAAVRGRGTRWAAEVNGNTVTVIDKLPPLGVGAGIACEVLSEDGDVAVVRLRHDVAGETEPHLPTKSLRR